MGNKFLWLVIVLLVAIATWFWLPRNTEPSLSFSSPSGGENWQSGEERTISWDSRGIPTGDKISITIRRLPPPPIPAEGQEFDPIIFTDLPNTGSTTWKISPMYPDGDYVLGISAYKSVPVTNPISAESGRFTLKHPAIAQDLYPLYDAVEWTKPEVESFLIGTTSYAGASISSAPLDAGPDRMNPASVITPFERYFDTKLKMLGWKVANDLAAGGHVGGQTGYRKGSGLILTRFHIDYHVQSKDAPSECPCDVTLSVFSGQ